MATEHQALRVSRRRFVQGAGVAGLGLLAGCRWWPGQASPPVTKVHRIAFVGPGRPGSTAGLLAAFRQGMQELGYVEGQNLLIDERYANGLDQLAEQAAELVRFQPEVILVPGANSVPAVQAATATTPIVNANVSSDLVRSGLAATYARPGGTVTGLGSPDLVGKQLQLLQEVVPALSQVAVFSDQRNADFPREPYEAAARRLELQLGFVSGGGAQDLELMFDTATRERADGLFLPTVGWITANRVRIAERALQSRLPTMWQQIEAVGPGGLMAYAANRAAGYRRAAYYVDKILHGAQPADLPIEQPREFEFVINLKTAQALGLTIPQHVLLQATELIQ
jgi:putative ABC transport system substrate-binding protein